MRSTPLHTAVGLAVAARAAAKVRLGGCVEFIAAPRKRKRGGGLGFNMKKVSDEPLKDYDSGPKVFEARMALGVD